MKKTVKPYTIGTGNEVIMYLVPSKTIIQLHLRK